MRVRFVLRALGPWKWVPVVFFLAAAGYLLKVYRDFLICDPTRSDCLRDLWLNAAIAVIGFLAVVVGTLLTERNSRRREIDQARGQVLDLLKGATSTMFKPTEPPTIRSNVMLRDWKGNLRIVWALNMNDARLEWRLLAFRRGEGVCGVAWELGERDPEGEGWRPVIAPDLSKVDTSRWGLKPMQKTVTDKIRWIVSTPMIHNRRVVGVVNIDSTGERPFQDSLTGVFGNPPDFAEACKTLAKSVAEIASKHDLV